MIGKVIKYCVIGLIVLAALFGAQKIYNLFYENQKLHEELIGQKHKYEQLNKYSAKLEIQYKDQVALTEQLKEQWQQEMDALKGQILILSNSTFSVQEKERTEKESDIYFNGGYTLNEVRFTDGPPVGYVLMSKDGQVQSKLYNYDVEVKTVVTKDNDTGKYNIASKAEFVLRETPKNTKYGEWLDKPYSLPITGGTAVVDPTEEVKVPTSRFYLFAPKLGGGVHFYIDDVLPYVGMSLMGIGQSKRDMSWRFAEVGIEYSKTNKLALTLVPIMYRPFPNALSNTYIDAGVSYSTTGKRYFIGLGVGF